MLARNFEEGRAVGIEAVFERRRRRAPGFQPSRGAASRPTAPARVKTRGPSRTTRHPLPIAAWGWLSCRPACVIRTNSARSANSRRQRAPR